MSKEKSEVQYSGRYKYIQSPPKSKQLQSTISRALDKLERRRFGIFRSKDRAFLR